MSRILHIEDDPANLLLVRKLLQAAGHEVTEAQDGIEGVRLALQRRPDLVLVDLRIPGLDGYEVALRLRGEASLTGVPIVAITAEGDRETSLAVGCDGFLRKPIDARSFASSVGRYLKGVRESVPDVGGDALILRHQSQRIVARLEEKIAELSAVNARLRELDAARTTFYRTISHELATPMTPIVGYVKLLRDQELGPLDKGQLKAVVAMDGCVQRLRSLLDDLVDVTGLETGRMRFSLRDYDVLEVTRRALGAVGDKLAGKELMLVEELPRGPLPAWGDDARLGRAIVHLLDNAAKFTPRGGTVGVRLRRSQAGYEITIADTGPGIPATEKERVFEAFYQIDGSATREHGGTGVGLAIARRTARGLGGELHVVSPCSETIEGALLRGSAFHLALAARAPAEAT
jgi:signal transduction histidine kinase